jgi:transposase
MVAIAITRTDMTAGELRAAAARSRDARAARRMLAVALVLEGVDRKTAAETCGMDRQTLRDWVHRDNAEGLAGLSNRRGAPRSPRLDRGQVAELVSWLETGPDPAPVPMGDGVVRWRRQDLRARIAERFGVELHERTVGK